jgi:hypothetical protein
MTDKGVETSHSTVDMLTSHPGRFAGGLDIESGQSVRKRSQRSSTFESAYTDSR